MARKKTEATETSVIAYKAFDRNLQCRGYQYEVGKTFEHKGSVALCDKGFHSCENPLDVLSYYDICDGIRFAQVRASGKIDRKSGGDTKIASAVLHIEAELTLPDFIKRAIQWVSDACKVDPAVEVNSGEYATNASSGEYATNASSGEYATNASSGEYATNASSGDSATNASSGHYATNASSGDYAKNASSGHSAKNASSGHYATNEATGKHSVIAAAGRGSLAKGAVGVWISLAEYAELDGEYRCVGFATGQAGHDGVPADVWLKASGGKLVEA